MYSNIISFIKELYPNQDPIPLHAPVFNGNEKKYLIDCIDSTFVSYVGKYVNEFERLTAEFTGSKYSVAVVNGTAALRIALLIAGVKSGEEVITQPLTFVATANAISHCGAQPIFIDVDLDTMGLSPDKLNNWLERYTKYDVSINKTINKLTGKVISGIVPMHTFGFPVVIDEIINIANKYNIPVIEDAAESLGSFYKNKHTGTFGIAGVLSFNGNKTITTGGGGIILTDNEDFARKAKHLTTTAKIPHSWEFIHNEIAFNYRLTNLNAAVGVAQMEKLEEVLNNKRDTTKRYSEFFKQQSVEFVTENSGSKANYWLNCVKLDNKNERDIFLKETNNNGIMARPIWRLMNKLEMYKNCQKGNLDNSEWLEDRIVNIPSGFRK